MYLLWQLLGDSPLLIQGLTLLQLAFTIWMLVDAYRRHAESFWFWVILLFQPLGAWFYFFAVKFRTLRLPGTQRTGSWETKLSLDELRYRVERSPTVSNRCALAERLMEKKQHADAIPHLEKVLAFEPDYCAALHSLAVCRLATGAPDEAVAPLNKLLQRDYRWGNYLAWRTLIDVQLARSQPGEALAACRELEKRLPTLEHKCLLAEHLLDNGSPTEAVQLLDQALEDYQYTPWSARMRNWNWARNARRLLAEAEKQGKQRVGNRPTD